MILSKSGPNLPNKYLEYYVYTDVWWSFGTVASMMSLAITENMIDYATKLLGKNINDGGENEINYANKSWKCHHTIMQLMAPMSLR